MIVQGVNSDGIALPLLIDSQGRVILTASQPSAQRPTAVHQRYENLNLAAGTGVQVIATVPAGQVWRLTHFGHRYTGTVATVSLQSRIVISGVGYQFFNTAPPVSGFMYTTFLNILLEGGYEISTFIVNATLNDDFLAVALCERIE